MDSDMEEGFRKKNVRRRPYPGEHSFKNSPQEVDLRLETTRSRLANVLKRHDELKIRLSRDSDKVLFERLQKEFEAAREAQTDEISLDGEQWNDGLLAMIRERTRFTWKQIGRRRRIKGTLLIPMLLKGLHIEFRTS